ncbi:acetyltransferase [Streptomonospora alba]|uniref:Acetyltransferase n=1 Tax=Streptomonospora alba TaxID=183763 RepID=A0A0C2FHY2_9ACTN|nr:GNAT family N-acetyltransferase [Streptomonospora alba]KIH98899.1 acetyltransferase [Streptomonospora alba]
MFTMRPATGGDPDAVAAMIHARCDWMEERGLPSWRENVGDLAGQAASGAMWVLQAGGRIAGCTTVLPQAPPGDWTPEETAAPSLYLFTTVTDPAYRRHRPGTLITAWAVDHTARHGRAWVRLGCFSPDLARYYERQGFTLVRKRQREGVPLYLLARRAERLDLDALGLSGGT